MPSNVQDFPDGVTEDDNFIVDYYKEVTGYDFDIVVLGSEDEATQLNVMFNSGEVNGIVVSRNIKAIALWLPRACCSPGSLQGKFRPSITCLWRTIWWVCTMAASIPLLSLDAITAVSYLGAWCVNQGRHGGIGV